MNKLDLFAWGFGGSFAIEIVDIYNIFLKDQQKLPNRYRKKSFWIIRILIAIIAGFITIAYDVNSKLLAINVGISAPLILQKLSANNMLQTTSLHNPIDDENNNS